MLCQGGVRQTVFVVVAVDFDGDMSFLSASCPDAALVATWRPPPAI